MTKFPCKLHGPLARPRAGACQTLQHGYVGQWVDHGQHNIAFLNRGGQIVQGLSSLLWSVHLVSTAPSKRPAGLLACLHRSHMPATTCDSPSLLMHALSVLATPARATSQPLVHHLLTNSSRSGCVWAEANHVRTCCCWQRFIWQPIVSWRSCCSPQWYPAQAGRLHAR